MRAPIWGSQTLVSPPRFTNCSPPASNSDHKSTAHGPPDPRPARAAPPPSRFRRCAEAQRPEVDELGLPAAGVPPPPRGGGVQPRARPRASYSAALSSSASATPTPLLRGRQLLRRVELLRASASAASSSSSAAGTPSPHRGGDGRAPPAARHRRRARVRGEEGGVGADPPPAGGDVRRPHLRRGGLKAATSSGSGATLGSGESPFWL